MTVRYHPLSSHSHTAPLPTPPLSPLPLAVVVAAVQEVQLVSLAVGQKDSSWKGMRTVQGAVDGPLSC